MRLEMLFITLLLFIFLGIDFLVYDSKQNEVDDYTIYLNESEIEPVSYVEIPAQKELIVQDELTQENKELEKLQNSSLVVIIE